MSSFLDLLYIKRFCLPCNTDLDTLFTIKKIKKNELCSLNNYNHIACVLSDDGKILSNNTIILKKTNVMSYGVNYYGDLDGNIPGIHAEINAINKLPKCNKKNTYINLIVLRLSKNNKIQNSKPCQNCIQKLSYLPNLKGYKIKHIYYSDNEENIVKCKLNDLQNESPHISKFYRRNQKNNS